MANGDDAEDPGLGRDVRTGCALLAGRSKRTHPEYVMPEPAQRRQTWTGPEPTLTLSRTAWWPFRPPCTASPPPGWTPMWAPPGSSRRGHRSGSGRWRRGRRTQVVGRLAAETGSGRAQRITHRPSAGLIPDGVTETTDVRRGCFRRGALPQQVKGAAGAREVEAVRPRVRAVRGSAAVTPWGTAAASPAQR